MLELNLNHPDYSLAMELLCCLPPMVSRSTAYPSEPLMTTLAVDLNLQSQGIVRGLIDELDSECGISVVVFRHGGNRAAVASHHWRAALAMAQDYLARVYDDTSDHAASSSSES